MTYFQAKYEQQTALLETITAYYEAAREALERVQELHKCVETRDWPYFCDYCGQPHPCETIQALEGITF